MKQTAVEWLTEKLIVEFGFAFSNNILEQAIEIEKQQIIKTWYDCKLSMIEKNPTDADQYYNEKFKNNDK